mmetsp:Transcript_13910/g.39068  ORF Transcript_13910/g.39068 Transcript_13910/m.39068 type:complete len:188 (-) Transcript_13910:575-1138(-)
MFLPEAVNEKNAADEARKEAYRKIDQWSLELMPEAIRGDAQVSAQEIVCGDPECAPIDTVVTFVFMNGKDGMIGLPMEAREVTKEELASRFPTVEVLEKWHRGEDAEWPPYEEPEFPELRFDIGTRVLCRIGADAEKDWAPGKVVQLWYSEENWPPGSFAPYKVRLDDGRDIFAPGDMDQVIRKQES